VFRQIWRSARIVLLAVSFVRYYWQLRWIARFRPGRRQELEAVVFARAGARVRRAALHLQGLIVKVGQFLSARADVLPLSFTRELTQLQDAVPAAPFARIKTEVERALGAELTALFSTFSPTATAAASLGQVHRAVLPDGRVVAVKILRPGIVRLAQSDLSALRVITWYLERFTKFGRRLHLNSIYEEFARGVNQELDYRSEADFLKRFRKDFEQDEKIAVPGLVDGLIARNVLVMDFIEGCKVTDSAQLAAWNVDPATIVELLVDAYLRQMLQYGLVHIDPHPGNLLVLEDGRLCFLDFGMMAEVPSEEVQVFAKLVQAAIAKDLDGIVAAVDKLGFLQPYANREILKQAVGMMLDRLNGFQLQRGPELDRFIEDFQDFLHDEPLILQARYLFIGRAIGLLSGVLTGLQPTIDWWSLLKERALPLLSASTRGDQARQDSLLGSARRLVGELFGDTGEVAFDLILDQATKTGASLLRLPGELDRVLQKVERGELNVQLDLSEALVRIDRLQELLTRILWLVLGAGFLSLALWLQAQGHLFERNAGFVLTGLCLLLALRRPRRRDRSRRRTGPRRPPDLHLH